MSLLIQPLNWDHVPDLGDSVSVSGCCLTVAGDVDPRRPVLRFDVVRETLSKTRLGGLKVGEKVNLEHAATATTLLGGHVVQGHVDGLGEVERVRRGGDWRVRIAVPLPGNKSRPTDPATGDLMQYIIPKGSVCVDGVSLTVAGLWSEKSRRGFEVALIPATLAATTLKSLRLSDTVNLEVDCMVKAVVHWLRNFGGPSGHGLPIEPPAARSVRKRRSKTARRRR